VKAKALGKRVEPRLRHSRVRSPPRIVMSTAPEPYLSACLRVLYSATVEARALAWDGQQTPLNEQQVQRLADLMDAVHNIPLLLTRWEECNESLLRGMLCNYDTKWGAASRTLLAVVYQDVVDASRSGSRA
jgi:hypothetical protein